MLHCLQLPDMWFACCSPTSHQKVVRAWHLLQKFHWLRPWLLYRTYHKLHWLWLRLLNQKLSCSRVALPWNPFDLVGRNISSLKNIFTAWSSREYPDTNVENRYLHHCVLPFPQDFVHLPGHWAAGAFGGQDWMEKVHLLHVQDPVSALTQHTVFPLDKPCKVQLSTRRSHSF